MACGKPVVATKVGGNGEIIKSRDYGILVDLDDQEQLKGAIIQALEIEWDHGKISEYAFQNTWERAAINVLHEFGGIIITDGLAN